MKKINLSFLTLKQRAIYAALKAVEPIYIYLRDSVQTELNRIRNLEAIAKGAQLREEFLERQKKLAPSIIKAVDDKKTYEQIIKEKQENCRHTKGGRLAGIHFKDYAVQFFVFIDDSRRIKCMICQKEWWKTRTFTTPGWSEACKMMDSSTNTPNSCEVPSQNIGVPNGPDNLSSRLS